MGELIARIRRTFAKQSLLVMGAAAVVMLAIAVLAFAPLLVRDCASGSLCFELVKGAPAAFITVVIGSVATGIAWRQHETARAKLKLDLFERRFAIFQRTWGFLSEISQKGPGEAAFTEFSNVIPEAAFLFGSDIEAYLNEMTAKRTELWLVDRRTKSNSDVMKPEDIDKEVSLTAWFYDEASAGVKRAFAPYLDFSRWT